MSFLKGVKGEIEIRLEAVIESDLGKVIKVPFVAKYRRLKVSEAKALLERAGNGETTDDDIIREHLIGWREMKGEDGDEVAFTPEVLEEALQELGYRNALVNGFSIAQFGAKAALQKN